VSIEYFLKNNAILKGWALEAEQRLKRQPNESVQ
jgi:hypothetical protein